MPKLKPYAGFEFAETSPPEPSANELARRELETENQRLKERIRTLKQALAAADTVLHPYARK
jgi:hypothetical protein